MSLLVCSVLLPHDEPWLALRRLYFINGASFLLFTMRYHWLGATAFPPYGSSFTIATLSWAKPLLVSAAATPDGSYETLGTDGGGSVGSGAVPVLRGEHHGDGLLLCGLPPGLV